MILGRNASLTTAFGTAVVICTTLGATAVASFNRLRKYWYDEHGLHQGRKSVVAWENVRKVAVSYAKSRHSAILAARPTIYTVLSGPLLSRVTLLSYSVLLRFELDNGSSISIPTDFDKISDSALENMRDLARVANPSIKFE